MGDYSSGPPILQNGSRATGNRLILPSGPSVAGLFNATSYYAPMRVGRMTITALEVDVTIVGSAGSLLRLGLYADAGPDTIPDDLIVDGGTVTGEVLGRALVTLATPIAWPGGIIHTMAQSQGLPATHPTVRHVNIPDVASSMPNTLANLTQRFLGASIPGAFPATAPLTAFATVAPLMGIHGL